MISAISSSGYSFCMLKFRTTVSKDIVHFLTVFLHFVKHIDILKGNEIGIILDNCRIHRTKIVHDFAERENIKLFYLPPYAPELAPIETYFAKLKSSAVRRAGWELINLKSKAGVRLVLDVIKNIKSDYIKSLWTNYMNLLKDELIKFGQAQTERHI